MSERLPRDVRALIRDHVASVGELDLLMLLHEQRDRGWTAEAVSAALGAPVPWATMHLRSLEAAGLLDRESDGWRLQPRTGAHRDGVDALARLYRTRRRDVVQYVFAQTPAVSRRSARRP